MTEVVTGPNILTPPGSSSVTNFFCFYMKKKFKNFFLHQTTQNCLKWREMQKNNFVRFWRGGAQWTSRLSYLFKISKTFKNFLNFMNFCTRPGFGPDRKRKKFQQKRSAKNFSKWLSSFWAMGILVSDQFNPLLAHVENIYQNTLLFSSSCYIVEIKL